MEIMRQSITLQNDPIGNGTMVNIPEKRIKIVVKGDYQGIEVDAIANKQPVKQQKGNEHMQDDIQVKSITGKRTLNQQRFIILEITMVDTVKHIGLIYKIIIPKFTCITSMGLILKVTTGHITTPI